MQGDAGTLINPPFSAAPRPMSTRRIELRISVRQAPVC